MKPKRIMCLDPGEKRIGVAISDESGLLAVRLTTLENTEDVLEKIKKLADSYHIEKIVVGRARSMDGSLGPQAEKAKELGRDVTMLGFEVDYEDETATTEAAYAKLKNERITGEAAKKLVDMVAAEIILQGYLNSKN